MEECVNFESHPLLSVLITPLGIRNIILHNHALHQCLFVPLIKWTWMKFFFIGYLSLLLLPKLWNAKIWVRINRCWSSKILKSFETCETGTFTSLRSKIVYIRTQRHMVSKKEWQKDASLVFQTCYIESEGVIYWEGRVKCREEESDM